MIKKYKKNDIAIVWDNSKCTHAGNCVRGLPKVFKPKERPWIQTDNSDRESIAEQVQQCPSGALTIEKIESK